MKKFILMFMMLLVFTNTLSQDLQSKSGLTDIINSLRRYKLDSLEYNIENLIKTPSLKRVLIWKYKSLKDTVLNSFPKDVLLDTTLSNRGKLLTALFYGDYYKAKSFDNLALEQYTPVFYNAVSINDSIIAAEAIRRIIYTINQRETLDSILVNNLNYYKAYAYDQFEIDYYNLFHARVYSHLQKSPYIKELLQGAKIAKKNNHNIILAYYYKLLGVKYAKYNKLLIKKGASKNNMEKSIDYFNKSYRLYSNYLPNGFAKDELSGILINKGKYYFMRGKYSKSEQNFIEAKKYLNRDHIHRNELFNHEYSKTLFALGKYEEAYSVKEEQIELTKKKFNDKIDISVAEINTKYETEKKKAENEQLTNQILLSENERLKLRKNSIYVFSVLFSIMFFGSLTSYLFIKNSRRKRLLAIQEKELESQKNLTLLKEQEINSINAMVEGQEKERKRVAEDLHDNLGSVIATLKLHFENLRINRETKKIDQETLFDKTEGLIDEAYKKVRSIAHAKNAGVIANQGLLVAVQMMAEKISSANTIQIEVIHYGLEKPIENSLEISLFRIIQELTTNIIKHSQATQATINISQDQDDITILIEDNGIGMKTSQIDSKKGMGIHSIKTRVEHLSGGFTIDSTPTKGTTIIINIPT